MSSFIRHHRKWLWLALKLAIVGLLAWLIIEKLRETPDDLQKFGHDLAHLQPVWLAVCGALYLLTLLPAALFWHRLLRALGQHAGLFKTLRAYYIGHLGKYVPGKALVVVMRAALVRGPGVETGVAAATVFVETLTMMASGSFIAAALIALLGHSHWEYVAAAVGCMVVAALPTFPPLLNRLVHLTRFGRTVGATAHFAQISYGTLLMGWIGTGIGWFIAGLSLWAALRAMGNASLGPIDGLPLWTMVTCVSIVAGFMSMIPAGLGVREVVMIQLMVEWGYGAADASASVVVQRLAWLAAELVISAVLYPMRPKAASDTVTAGGELSESQSNSDGG